MGIAPRSDSGSGALRTDPLRGSLAPVRFPCLMIWFLQRKNPDSWSRFFLERVMGIEPTSSAYPATISPAVRRAILFRGSRAHCIKNLQRVMGIEPTYSAWKADIIAIILHPL